MRAQWGTLAAEGQLHMRNLLRRVSRLVLWKKLILGATVILILLTWLAVCLVLTGYLVP